MLLVDDAGSRLEERCSSTFNHPGDVYHPNFTNGKLAYFDVFIWNTKQPLYIIPSQLWLELLQLLERKKKILITRQMWKLQADVSTL